MTTKEMLQGALALFGPNGEKWVNRQPRPGEQCIITALCAVCIPGDFGVRLSGYRLLEEIAGLESNGLGAWNDAPERTWPEVKAAFEKAIKAC